VNVPACRERKVALGVVPALGMLVACGSLANDDPRNEDPVERTCPSGTYGAPAYLADPERQCVDTTTVVAVHCTNEERAPTCSRRISDGRLYWITWRTREQDDWAECSSREYDATRRDCAFLRCDGRMAASACSFEDTCQTIGCGSYRSPLDANGCARKPCLASSECPAGDECLASMYRETAECFYVEGSCRCAGPSNPADPPRYCSVP
jgi:hypothetical protein